MTAVARIVIQHSRHPYAQTVLKLMEGKVTVMLQWTYSGVTVVLQWYHTGLIVAGQWCYSCLAVVLVWFATPIYRQCSDSRRRR
jgi:hypothetical protein